MRRKWQITQLLDEWNTFRTIFKKLGMEDSVESHYYPHPNGDIERVLYFGVEHKPLRWECGFNVHEVRSRYGSRCIWVDIGATTSRKLDERVIEKFRAACKNLVIRFVLEVIFQHDYKLFREITFINLDEQDEKLVVRFKEGEIEIPVEQLSEQALKEALANFVPCA